MKKISLTILAMMISGLLFSQEININIAYTNFHNNQWDDIIRTYNFSRPYLNNNQPLLKDGISVELNYILKSSKRIKQAVDFEYDYYNSNVKNENFQNALNLHFIKLGYLLHYKNQKKFKNLYADFKSSIIFGGLYRNINFEPLLIDEESAKALGVGFVFNLNCGYQFNFNKKMKISPFVGLGYCPYYHSTNTESILNQTNGIVSDNVNVNFWEFKAGVNVNLKFN